MSESYDVILIGAGIIGTGIALALSRGGRDVLVLDRHPAAGYGSTSNSVAIIRTFYSTRASCALAWEGSHYWRNWRDFLGAGRDEELAQYIPCPALALRNGEPDHMDEICAHHDALGIPYETLSPHEVQQRFPAIDLTGYAPPRRPEDEDFGRPSGRDITGAILFAESGYVTDPQLAARNMQHAAERHGAQFRFGAEVRVIRRHKERASGVTLADGTDISAALIINAAGPYSSRINSMAGVTGEMRLTTRPLRQEVCHLPALDGLGGQMMFIDPDTGGYCRTEPSGTLLSGSTEPACDALHWVDDPDSLDRNPTEQWTAQAYRTALRLPKLGIPNQASGVTDLYDVSEDWTPIYDVSGLPGFYMAVGTSGNQFKNGPVAGDLMAALIDWQERGHDHDQQPCRFKLTRTGGWLDLSAFSRNREPAVHAENVLG